MSDRTPMQPVTGLTKTQRPSVASVPGPPPRPARTTPQPPPPETAPTLDQGTGESTTNVRQIRRKSPAAPKSAESTGGTRDVTFTLPIPLRDALRDRARTGKDETIPSIVLAALEANVNDLQKLVDLEKGNNDERGGLFPDPTSNSRPTETRVAQTMRLSERNLAVVDVLVSKAGAHDRSQLLTAALRPHLSRTSGD
jgi:hypothetical protein